MQLHTRFIHPVQHFLSRTIVRTMAGDGNLSIILTGDTQYSLSEPGDRSGLSGESYWDIVARRRLLSTKKAQESHEAIAECGSSFLSA